MNPNIYLWGMAIGIAVPLGFIAWCWWHTREPKPKRDLSAVVLREAIIPCDGCGCLLFKRSQFKQSSTVENVKKIGVPVLLPSGSYEWILEHYLCLRCQVDGTPPAKVAEAIDEARTATGEKPC